MRAVEIELYSDMVDKWVLIWVLSISLFSHFVAGISYRTTSVRQNYAARKLLTAGDNPGSLSGADLL